MKVQVCTTRLLQNVMEILQEFCQNISFLEHFLLKLMRMRNNRRYRE